MSEPVDPTRGSREPTSRETDLLWRYLDRINEGETISPEEILREHPQAGTEILRQLDAFQRLTSTSCSAGPLGVLGDYTLRRQIGRGGMGVVYEAWQSSLERQVALKVLPGGITADDKAFHRFMREAKTAAKLCHPHIVGVYGMGVEQNTPYYAMELVEGETLAQVIAKLMSAEAEAETPFGKKHHAGYFEKIAVAFADVADGLQHAHSKKVIHRDIKPSNLILDGKSRVRILDFGLARLEGQESLTLSGDFLGTPQYMSPEQARRKKIPIDHRTDVYSLGATLYEVLTLRPPFQGKDHQDTLYKIIEWEVVEPRKMNPRVPKDLETIVMKCLRKEAADRYGTAEALGQDLRRAARGEAIEACPERSWSRWARRLRAHRSRVAIAVLLSLLAVSILVHLTGRHRLSSKAPERNYDAAVAEAARFLELEWFTERHRDPHPPLSVEPLPGSMSAAARFASIVDGLETAIASLPDRPEAHYYLALAHWKAGRIAESRSRLKALFRLEPEHPSGRELLNKIAAEKDAQRSLANGYCSHLLASTLIGGAGTDEAWDVASLPGGEVAIVGTTDSRDFPVRAGFRYAAGGDACLVRLDATGHEIVYSTCFGGSSFDMALACAVDGEGRVLIVGYTDSPDFPVTEGCLAPTYNGRRDGFLVCLRPDPTLPPEQQLVYATYLGGAAEDGAVDVGIGPGGIATLVGYTASTDFPVSPNAFQRTHRGGAYDVFVAQILPDGRKSPEEQLLYSTLIGGTDDDTHPLHVLNRECDQAVAVEANGEITVVGRTASKDFPVTPGAFDPTHNGGHDAYLLRLNPARGPASADQLVYGTFLGGGMNESAAGVVVEPGGVVTITGWTWSSDFPVSSDAVAGKLSGANDVFVTRLRVDGKLPPREQLIYSGLFGGSGIDYPTAMAGGPAGLLFIAGETQSSAFPVTPDACRRTLAGFSDAFLTILDLSAPGQPPIRYSTYLGGARSDAGTAVAVDGDGRAHVVGIGSLFFPTAALAYQAEHAGGFYDGFLASFELENR